MEDFVDVSGWGWRCRVWQLLEVQLDIRIAAVIVLVGNYGLTCAAGAD